MNPYTINPSPHQLAAALAFEPLPEIIVEATVDQDLKLITMRFHDGAVRVMSFAFLKPRASVTLLWDECSLEYGGTFLSINVSDSEDRSLRDIDFDAAWIAKHDRNPEHQNRAPKHIDPKCRHCGHALVLSSSLLGHNPNGDPQDFNCPNVQCEAYNNGIFLDMNEDQLIANGLVDAPPVRTFCAKVYHLAADYPSLWDSVTQDVIRPLFALRRAKDYAGINERLAALDVSKLSWAMVQAILGSMHMREEEQLLVPEHARFWERVKAHYGNDTKLWSWLEDSVRSLL